MTEWRTHSGDLLLTSAFGGTDEREAVRQLYGTSNTFNRVLFAVAEILMPSHPFREVFRIRKNVPSVYEYILKYCNSYRRW